MVVAPGNILIELLPKDNVQDGIAVVDRKRSTSPPTGVVVQVGQPDEFGTPVWVVGQTVWTPAIGGQDFEFGGKKYRVVHHRRILLGEDPV